jgi:exoribonuclease R
MNTESITDKLLAFVASAEYRPMKPRMILNHLKLTEDEYRELRRSIKKLVREGRLLFGANHLVLPSVYSSPGSGNALRVKRGESRNSLGDETQQSERMTEDLSNAGSSNPGFSVSGLSEVIGVFRRALSAGYGFVELPRGKVTTPNAPTVAPSPEGAIVGMEPVESATVESASSRLPDVFIPETRTSNAMDGDTVRVRLRKSTSPSRRSAGANLRNNPARLEG